LDLYPGTLNTSIISSNNSNIITIIIIFIIRTCSPNAAKEKCVEVIGGKARGKETTRKTKTYVEDNIKKDLLEIGLGWCGLN
jgi:hypothetical protein